RFAAIQKVRTPRGDRQGFLRPHDRARQRPKHASRPGFGSGGREHAPAMSSTSFLFPGCESLGAALRADRSVGAAMNDSPAGEPGSQDRARPLLIIVAYEAESHLPELIGRLAQVEGMKERWFILLLDDASRDGTNVRAKALF